SKAYPVRVGPDTEHAVPKALWVVRDFLGPSAPPTTSLTSRRRGSNPGQVHIHCDDPLAVVAIEEIEGGHPLGPVPDLEAIGAAHHTGDTPDQDPVAAAIRIAESAGVPVVYDRGF